MRRNLPGAYATIVSLHAPFGGNYRRTFARLLLLCVSAALSSDSSTVPTTAAEAPSIRDWQPLVIVVLDAERTGPEALDGLIGFFQRYATCNISQYDPFETIYSWLTTGTSTSCFLGGTLEKNYRALPASAFGKLSTSHWRTLLYRGTKRIEAATWQPHSFLRL